MIRRLFILLAIVVTAALAPGYPYALALATSEATPGAAVPITIAAPADAAPAVSAPGLLVTTPAYYGGDTWEATLIVPRLAVRGRVTPVTLLVDGRPVFQVSFRVDGFSLFLPILYK